MQIKTYLTERGAEGFARKMKARWPHRIFQLATMIGRDFRTRYYVETYSEFGTRDGQPAWIACGPLSR